MEIPGILIQILGFSFEILGISKICDNRISQKWAKQGLFCKARFLYSFLLQLTVELATDITA